MKEMLTLMAVIVLLVGGIALASGDSNWYVLLSTITAAFYLLFELYQKFIANHPIEHSRAGRGS